MRRTSPALGLIGIALLHGLFMGPAIGQQVCRFDPAESRLICEESGGSTAPPAEKPDPAPKPAERYVYLTTRRGVGECHYWSTRAGGIDAWDPGNDQTIINIVRRTPECPARSAPIVDAEATAWSIFRSWPLAAPRVSLQPVGTGITGLATYLAAPSPPTITHFEVLPDGRTLRVRARVEYLDVTWGDGTIVRYQPSGARRFPDGTVTHTYLRKTCTDVYRNTHPSGRLCHPTMDRYHIDATFSWFAEFSTGGSWIDLGSLSRTTESVYFVDEARGIPIL